MFENSSTTWIIGFGHLNFQPLNQLITQDMVTGRKEIQKFFCFDYANEIIMHTRSGTFRCMWCSKNIPFMETYILFRLSMSLVESCGSM